ncbi:MAG: MiaB/RimO family radical SAM methylthiotransferase [Parcubacteria group bacterium]|nr:MiaB/RimO family radical SAM methylthiotransferase [Parcubacteria group bacterium]
MITAKQKFYILTFGCQMNHSDSERIQAVLEGVGFTKTESEDEANLIVVNSCAVRQTAMDRIHGKVKVWGKLKKQKPLKTLLTGCVLDEDKKKFAPHFDWVLPIKDLPSLPELLGYQKLELSDYFAVKPKYNNQFSAFVPIMTGCDKFCTFCAVPYTRGREISRSYNDILKEVQELAARGYKEITLLGQNVNSYLGAPDRVVAEQEARRVGQQVVSLRSGHSLQEVSARKSEVAGTINFPQLLQKVCGVPGDFWVQFTTSHPYDMSDELIETMSCNPKIGKYINFPVQSGSDAVLKRMNRCYTVEHYKERAAKLRKWMPDIVISTDIIVGFCGETEEEFDATVQLMKEVKYDMAFISEYSTRPGTAAAKLYKDDVPAAVKAERKEILTKILAETALEHNQRFIGRRVPVLVDEAMPMDGGFFMNSGKTDQCKTIRFHAGRDFTGQFAVVEVTAAIPWALEGVLA